MAQFRDKDRISFSRPGIFGHCEAKTPALFMQNLKPDTCVVTYAPVSQATCNQMDFVNILKALKIDGISDDPAD